MTADDVASPRPSGSSARGRVRDAPARSAALRRYRIARRSRAFQHCEYGLFRMVWFVFAALPASVGLRVGAWLGELLCVLARRQRQIALRNLHIAFPEKSIAEHRRILRASCRNLGRLAAEFCSLPRLDADALAATVDFADRAAWERGIERAREKGAVVLTGHFGNWELRAYAHGLLGHPVTLVHRPLPNPLIDAAITAARARAGTRSIKKKAAAKDALRVLKQRGLLVIPSDQNQRASAGIFVDFFGVPASTTAGVARLAMLTGAPVFPVFLVRCDEGPRHVVEMLPEVEMVATGDRDADIRANTQRCARIIEDMIRRYPEQWIWFHKRWRTRPRGQPRLYGAPPPGPPVPAGG